MNEESNGVVQVQLAKSMLQPSLDEVRQIWPLLESDAVAVTLEHRLRLMAGLILRVKHAFLWDQAPRTMRALQRTGKIITIFAAYSLITDMKQMPNTEPMLRSMRFLAWLCDEAYEVLELEEGIKGLARHEYLILLTSNQSGDSACKVEGYDADPRISEGCATSRLVDAAVFLLYTRGGCAERLIRNEVVQISSLLMTTDLGLIADHIQLTRS